MKLKKILARVMVFVFSLNLIYINVNAEENKVLNEDNAVVTENKENKKRETTKGSTFKKNLDKAANAAKSGIKSVYQLAKTGVKYAAIGCCFAFGFYTFKHVKHKTKHIIKNMRKKSKPDNSTRFNNGGNLTKSNSCGYLVFQQGNSLINFCRNVDDKQSKFSLRL